MTKERSLTARRTGVPVSYEIEDRDRFGSKAGIWIMVAVVVVAFAMILQMESDRLHSKPGNGLARLVN